MISRRKVLKGIGAGGASALMLSHGLPALAAIQGSGERILAIYDPALKEAQAFARAAAIAGQEALPIAGDFAAMLYGSLRPETAPSRTSLLGLTSYADYLVAVGIGREKGLHLAGALLRENGAARMIGGNAEALAPHARACACEPLLSPACSTQTNVLWALA